MKRNVFSFTEVVKIVPSALEVFNGKFCCPFVIGSAKEYGHKTLFHVIEQVQVIALFCYSKAI